MLIGHCFPTESAARSLRARVALILPARSVVQRIAQNARQVVSITLPEREGRVGYRVEVLRDVAADDRNAQSMFSRMTGERPSMSEAGRTRRSAS